MRIIITIFVILLMLSNAWAQYSYNEKTVLYVGVKQKSWHSNHADEWADYAQYCLPFSFHHQINPRLKFNGGMMFFKSQLETLTPEKRSILQFSDLHLQTSWIWKENSGILTFGLGIPTGKTQLNKTEVYHAGLAANKALGYPVTLFGHGLNFNMSTAYVMQFGQWIVGSGASIFLRSKYKLYKLGNFEQELKPGHEINFTFGLERNFTIDFEKAQIAFDFTYSNYFKDELNGNPVFEAGDKFLPAMKISIPYGPFDPINFFLQYRIRLDNTSKNTELVDNANELEFGWYFYQPIRNNFKIVYELDSRIYSNTVSGADGAKVFGIGVGCIAQIADNQQIDPSINFYWGKLQKDNNTSISLTGFYFEGGIKYAF